MILASFSSMLFSLTMIQIAVNDFEYTLPFPVGKEYTVLQGNDSDRTHSKRFANGVFTKAYDFMMPMGDPVVATRDGIVVYAIDSFSDSDRTYGHENVLVIRHEDNVSSRYIHLKQGSIKAELGSFVNRGDTIALSGNSGFTANIPHLHFDIIESSSNASIQSQTINVIFKNSHAFPKSPHTWQSVKALEYIIDP